MKPIAKYITVLALAGALSFCPNLARADSPAGTQPAQKPAAGPSNQGQAAPNQPQQGTGGITERSLGGSTSSQDSGGGPGNRRMLRERERMHQHGHEMIAKLQAMQARLDEKLATMNETTGRDKLDAMAAVINEMVHQHDQIFSHIIEMQGHRMDRMQGGADKEDNEQREESE